MARAFIIRPFGKKFDSSGREFDFERVDRELISPALHDAGLDGGTTGQLVDAGNIREDMFALILEADLVVCDISIHNANVFYELGIRHALRRKHTLMIKGEPSNDKPPFDLSTDRYCTYEIDQPGGARDRITAAIRASMISDRETDSPIFQLLPSLAEANPSEIVVVPLDFSEEVTRAQSARAKGWLRLLAEEVQGERFVWEGLKRVATAQWDIGDHDGARGSWEKIREVYPDDIAANLAAANIYERTYRKSGQLSYLEVSDQAIDRVLANPATSRKQRAEARALKARNYKTRWRTELDKLGSAEDRRQEALKPSLIDCYEAYREAYFADLNHFYPGLNALQVGTILLELAQTDAWSDLFNDDKAAGRYREDLQEMVPSLRCLVSAAVAVALRQMSDDDPERVWAEISSADVLFLSEPQSERRVIRAYEAAIPRDRSFAWDATRGQLQLFADLGIRSDLATRVIQALDPRFADPEASKPVHLVIFAGHGVDQPGQPRRFPAAREEKARGLIRQAFGELADDQHEAIVLASGAPGGDILAHEVCAELGLRSIMCLPMPADAVVPLAFAGLDAWRTRFLNLWNVQQKQQCNLVLSDQPGLPRWLQRSGVDPWERGNRWVMKLAQAWGAQRLTLLAFWDGKEAGNAPGGTGHMVSLARKTGNLHIKIIDSNQLLDHAD